MNVFGLSWILEMYLWSVIFFGLVQQIFGHTVVTSESHYECGAHGKFEYCIDKDPGCVVGCHCHPGYYFDTDTKVCEPNLKLTQYRRYYDLEPTRLSNMNYDSVTSPTLTTPSNPVNEKVEAIAKDTDDLGDWLYNQFFKTIENQVINNTDSNIKTRRSGGDTTVKPKRRARKKNKKSKKKKKLSKKGLRSKLLRITEDDSLFDSSSSSTSDESEYSSSESESDSSDDHDHRKIVMINKKPTPPLPSFIFLPNVETPFYPPIGLPAPPIVPMYPMVPVPPMGMIFPSESTTSSCQTSPTTQSSTPSTSTLQSQPTAPTTETTTTTTAEVTKPPNEVDSQLLRMEGQQGKFDEFLQNNPNIKMGPQNKLLQKMRNKMKKRNKRPPPLPNVMEDIAEPEPPPFNLDRSLEYHTRRTDNEPKLEDVDFKYLSQLIHKIDFNQTETKTPFEEIPNFDSAFAALTRKSNIQHMPQIYPNIMPNNLNILPNNDYVIPHHKQRPISKADDVNDSYFTNLGKQIASLIRTHETNGNSEIDIDIQRQNMPSNMQSENFLDKTAFTQGRSYWERFIRSPLKSILSYIKSNDYHIQSGEDLISIENMVNVATATRKPFSLQELENIIDTIDQTRIANNKVQYQTTERTAKVNQNKFNLLPEMNKGKKSPADLSIVSDKVNVSHQVKGTGMSTRHINFAMLPHKVPKDSKIRHKKKNQHKSDKLDHMKSYLNLLRRNQTHSSGDVDNLNTLKNLLIMQSFKTPLHHQVSRIVQRNITNSNPLNSSQYMKQNSFMTYKNVNYMSNNHNLNKYHVQRSFLPYHLPIFKPTASKKSYFHHELHHFDFFDK